MLYTRDQIEAFSEDELSRKVLIPLFEHMGFTDVFYHHGGPLEQGKDIVMRRPDALHDVRNYAVVVKAKQITGAADSAGEVHTQIKQCFGSPFIDPRTHEKRSINTCLVVCSKSIKKEASNSLSSLLEIDPLIKANTEVIDGDKLWIHIKKYLPHFALLDDVHNGLMALNSIDPNYSFVITADEMGTKLSVKGKGNKSDPIKFGIKLQFPNTAEGKLKQEQFSEFLKHGTPIEIEKKYIQHLSFPPIMQRIINSNDDDDFILKFGPGKPINTPIATCLDFVSLGGEKCNLPYIELKCIFNSSDLFILTNDHQPVPIKIELIISKVGKECNFSFSFNADGITFLSYLDQLRLQKILSQGARITIYEFNSQLPIASFNAPFKCIPEISENLLDLVTKVAYIQKITGISINVPNRNFFLETDIPEIYDIYDIVHTGSSVLFPESISAQVDEVTFSRIKMQCPNGNIPNLGLLQDNSERLLMDTIIPLGPVEVKCKLAYINYNDTKEIELVDEKGNKFKGYNFKFRPAEGHKIEIIHKKWKSQSNQ